MIPRPSAARDSRRGFLALWGGLAALAMGGRSAAADGNWDVFKRRFIDGSRVVDTGNGNVSHSESQGWGMLFAQANDDRETFARLWQFTSSALQRADGLFSWRWTPATADHVPDKNNAADGDLLIAWALDRAARRWNDQRWLEPSKRIQTAVLNKLAVDVGGRLVLLPGEQGFVRNNRRVFNLSYYVWPAIHDFASQPGDQGRWRRLEDDGLWLLDNTAFGTYRLPPDWAMYGGNQDIRIADGWPPYFGFDAIRIPLYLAWQNEAARLPRFLAAWQTPRFAGRPPAWINLVDGAVAPFPSSGGYQAIAALTLFAAGGLRGNPPAADIVDNDDYYSASLKLLSNLAAREAPTAKRS